MVANETWGNIKRFAKTTEDWQTRSIKKITDLSYKIVVVNTQNG